MSEIDKETKDTKTTRNEGVDLQRVVIRPKRLTANWLEKTVKELKLTAFESTMARILLRRDSAEAMIKYLEGLAQKRPYNRA